MRMTVSVTVPLTVSSNSKAKLPLNARKSANSMRMLPLTRLRVSSPAINSIGISAAPSVMTSLTSAPVPLIRSARLPDSVSPSTPTKAPSPDASTANVLVVAPVWKMTKPNRTLSICTPAASLVPCPEPRKIKAPLALISIFTSVPTTLRSNWKSPPKVTKSPNRAFRPSTVARCISIASRLP